MMYTGSRVSSFKMRIYQVGSCLKFQRKEFQQVNNQVLELDIQVIKLMCTSCQTCRTTFYNYRDMFFELPNFQVIQYIKFCKLLKPVQLKNQFSNQIIYSNQFATFEIHVLLNIVDFCVRTMSGCERKIALATRISLYVLFCFEKFEHKPKEMYLKT